MQHFFMTILSLFAKQAGRIPLFFMLMQLYHESQFKATGPSDGFSGTE